MWGLLHFERLSPQQQKVVSQRLEELEATRIKDPEFEASCRKFRHQPGWNPKAFAESYGWRAHFNIHYFERLQSRARRRGASPSIWTGLPDGLQDRLLAARAGATD